MSSFSKSFYLLRHGETDWNKRNVFMGGKNIPLNENGFKQAYQMADSLQDISYASIATSPLMRARTTAQVLNQKILKPITVIDDLRESSWGVMEGKPSKGKFWVNDWRKGKYIEGAESFIKFKERVIRGINQALELPGPVLIVAHGGICWAIQDALGLPFLDIDNCTLVQYSPPNNLNYKNLKDVIC
ncbi:MAG: histidine phosphatase family protein [Rickettsiales bacterium]|jgi:probable phosphoglycerate mutase|nr:histidine phosphatase family protein [Rickettsiales bacterium]